MKLNFKKFLFFIKYYLPIILWAAGIFWLSSFSGKENPFVSSWDVFLRKGGHFFEYSVMALLFFRLFFFGHKMTLEKSFWLALIASGIYGISDEFHQTFVSGRGGKSVDSLFDFLSSLIILELVIFYIKRKIIFKDLLVLFLAVLSLLSVWLYMVNEARLYAESFVIFDSPGKNNPLEESKQDKFEEDDLLKRSQADISELPSKVFIRATFAPQAPWGVWDDLHEEACEEASLIIVKYFLSDEKLDKNLMEKEIKELAKFQIDKYGDYKDSDAREASEIFNEYYGPKIGKKLKPVYDFEKEDIKKYLAKGKPVIVPAAGRKLKNPYFKNPGPLYHMLVILGYEDGFFLTNDPGTKRGEGYRYREDVLFSAIHDFPGEKEEIEQGRKAMLVVE